EAGKSLQDLTMEDVRSQAARFLNIETVGALAERTAADAGDLLMIVAGDEKLVATVVGNLRSVLGERLGLAPPDHLAMAFVVDFPLMEWNEDEKRWYAMHHLFTSPQEADEQYLESDTGRVKARAYDVVCNGYELGGGSIRIHRREMQSRILDLMNYPKEEQVARF